MRIDAHTVKRGVSLLQAVRNLAVPLGAHCTCTLLHTCCWHLAHLAKVGTVSQHGVGSLSEQFDLNFQSVAPSDIGRSYALSAGRSSTVAVHRHNAVLAI